MCYNHEKFVRQSVESVLNQSYENIEIIIVDDASTDGSKSVIQEIVYQHPSIKFISIEKNIGNCRAFNKALAVCGGDFIIDLAADDLLKPNRLKIGVEALSSKGQDYGVHYGDVLFIDENGKALNKNSEQLKSRGIQNVGPEGDIYKMLLGKYFLSSPSMMSKREVFEHIKGYDETLAYEDLDFWVRSARVFKYCYTNDILVEKRVLSNSYSTRQYRPNSPQMKSTYQVCEKAFQLNRNKEEDNALLQRINYEIKWVIATFNLKLLYKYLTLIKRLTGRKSFD